MITLEVYYCVYFSRGYRDDSYQKSEVFLDPLTLFLTLGGVDHRTVAQLSRAVKPRTALRKKAAQYVQERRTVLGICGNKLKC